MSIYVGHTKNTVESRYKFQFPFMPIFVSCLIMSWDVFVLKKQYVCHSIFSNAGWNCNRAVCMVMPFDTRLLWRQVLTVLKRFCLTERRRTIPLNIFHIICVSVCGAHFLLFNDAFSRYFPNWIFLSSCCVCIVFKICM